MKLYVNCITSGAGLRRDIKELIPEMNIRRRMSRVVKSGVAAGIESLLEFGGRAEVDAIVTATGLGCIADSEKFLDALIANEETMLNPTPFIQSTFNTVGAQIALLRGLHCYNTTYANRWTSFENALTDAALRIGAGLSRAVLVGAFDETTPSAEKILQRLGVARQGGWGESSVFFVLTAEAFDTSVAAITGIRFPDGTAAGKNSGTGTPTGESSAIMTAAGNGCGRGSAAEEVMERTQDTKDSGTGTLAGSSSRTETPAGESSDMPAGNVTRPGTAPESGERRTVRASESGITPHFTAIAEVFRRVIAQNTEGAENAGKTGDVENTKEPGGTGASETAESTRKTEGIGVTEKNENSKQAEGLGVTPETEGAGVNGMTENARATENAGSTANTENTGEAGNTESTGNTVRRIVLYNDFPGSTVSVIELTCM